RNATAGAPHAATTGVTHAEVRGQLAGLLEGSVQDPQQAMLREHIAECPECDAELATLASTTHLLGTLPRRNAPNGVRQRLLAIPDFEQPQETGAEAVHRNLAAATCPPHYWQIEPRPHGWEHWTCHRCQAECDRPRGRARFATAPGEPDHAR